MIKVLLRNGTDVTGDWDSTNVQPRVATGNEVIAVLLELKGKDSTATFVLSEVIGWMTVKADDKEPTLREIKKAAEKASS